MRSAIITASAAINAAFWYRNEERQGHAVPADIDLEAQLNAATVPVPDVGS